MSRQTGRVCGKINMRVLMGAALTAKTFISILSQSNEKVTAKRELELEYDKKEIKPKETIRNECYRQSIFTQAERSSTRRTRQLTGL